MSNLPALTVPIVVSWLALAAGLNLRGADATKQCALGDFQSNVDIYVSQKDGKTTVSSDPACANKDAIVTFHTTGSGNKFSAVFDRPHPFLNDQRVYATGFVESGQIDRNNIGMKSHYEVCYIPANPPKPPCLDPKVIVNPTPFKPFISKNPVDFGRQVIGTSHDQTVDISSGSAAPVLVNVEPLTTGSPFKSTSCAFPANEKNKCTVTITFTPTRVEQERKSLIVRYEDEGPKEKTIKITGRGKAK
jgi:hypothetical protein